MKQAAKIAKGSGTTGRSSKVGSVTMEQIKEIAAKKMKDLNANDVDAASKMIAGSARSMGLEVIE